MNSKYNISKEMIILMTVGSALLYPYTFLPVVNSLPKNQDVWISMLLSLVYISLFSIPVLILIKIFRGFNVNQLTEIIAGKIIGKIFIVIFSLFFLFCYVACMLFMIIFIKIYILINTPEWALLLIMGIPILYGVYKGAAVIGRISLFIVPLIIISVVFYFVMALSQMDLDLIRPILADSTFLDLNIGGFLTASRYSDILIYLIFSYFVSKKINITKCFFTGLIIFGITYFLIIMSTLLVLGPDVARNEWNPYFVFTRQIETYDFLRRLQALNVITWFPGSLLKLMLYNFMISFMFQNVFKTKTHRPFAIGVSIVTFIILTFAFVIKASTIEFIRSDKLFPFIVLSEMFVFPLILLIIYLIRKKKIDKIIIEKRKILEEAEQKTE